jgi:hypothetical protein
MLTVHRRSMVEHESHSNKTSDATIHPNPSVISISPCLHSPLTQMRESKRWPAGRRSGIVERSRGGTLSRDLELVNLSVDAGEQRVPFLNSDEVGSGDDGPR